ncbi:MAG TPA: dihydrolipoamide acetyltransferase family protein [Steroidobacteraceae bacterium]|nr:dihydrolipoamide acetyltransferase family protein [Steroidobacteraceae bacterium]
MALVALEIPKVGLVMENARLVRWLKNVGDVVQQGEPLLELETEKSVVEIESTETGRLVEILLQADQEARVGDRIAWLENDAPSVTVAASVSPSVPGQAMASMPTPPITHGEAQTDRIRSSPVARRLAAGHALELQQITGTGPRGRVQLIDVQRTVESRAVMGTAAAAPLKLEPLSNMRRALARSVTLSNATVPQFHVERAVDWTALNALRAQLIAQSPSGAPSPSLNDFLLQGIARTLLAFAALNGTFWGDANSPGAGVVPAKGTHIGLVVAVADGLLVPVFHDVEQLGLVELARRRREIIDRALKGRLKREELEGATFSISNLGSGGPDRFNALINPPQSAILAVGRQRDCVVARSGSVHVRSMSQLTLTVDHRVADGRLASDFLASLVAMLEGGAWRLANPETEI